MKKEFLFSVSVLSGCQIKNYTVNYNNQSVNYDIIYKETISIRLINIRYSTTLAKLLKLETTRKHLLYNLTSSDDALAYLALEGSLIDLPRAKRGCPKRLRV